MQYVVVGAKSGEPREKTPDTPPASRTWLVSHMPRVGLEPKPDTTVSWLNGEVRQWNISALNQSARGPPFICFKVYNYSLCLLALHIIKFDVFNKKKTKTKKKKQTNKKQVPTVVVLSLCEVVYLYLKL